MSFLMDDLEDAVVAAVGDIDVAVGVHVDAVGLVKLGLERRAADSSGAFLAGARNAT